MVIHNIIDNAFGLFDQIKHDQETKTAKQKQVEHDFKDAKTDKSGRRKIRRADSKLEDKANTTATSASYKNTLKSMSKRYGRQSIDDPQKLMNTLMMKSFAQQPIAARTKTASMDKTNMQRNQSLITKGHIGRLLDKHQNWETFIYSN